MTQAEVTNWPLRLVLVAVVLAIIALVLLGMWRGWRRRAARQSDIPELPIAPMDVDVSAIGPIAGLYLASVSAGDWLDRIVAHGLGVRSRAEISAGPGGVLIERTGAPDVFIPAEAVRAARADRGIAGRAYERGGVLIVTWSLGGRLLDTGFRADRVEDHAAIIAAVQDVVPDSGSGTGEGSPE